MRALSRLTVLHFPWHSRRERQMVRAETVPTGLPLSSHAIMLTDRKGCAQWGTPLETVHIYRLPDLRPSYRARLQAAQREAAQVWTLCRDLHLSARQNHTSWPTQDGF